MAQLPLQPVPHVHPCVPAEGYTTQLSGEALGVAEDVGVWVAVREGVGVMEGDAPCDRVGVGEGEREGALHV